VGRRALIRIALAGLVAVPVLAGMTVGLHVTPAGAASVSSAHPASQLRLRQQGCRRHAADHRRCDPRRNHLGSPAAPATNPPSATAPPVPTDNTPPKFAGLQQAFACTPGPQSPGQTTPFTLSWEAAADDVTPPALIVYDIYLATTPGGEDFSQPTWTTPPGATSYRTPGLPSHGSFYFVVRARDQAGNEDGNTVERRGVDPCL
jgi:hypothetical protein